MTRVKLLNFYIFNLYDIMAHNIIESLSTCENHAQDTRINYENHQSDVNVACFLIS